MYLPIYVAKEKGLFDTLIPEIEVNLCIANGDYDAVRKMNGDNCSTSENIFALAVADPNAIRSVDNARIIGALIGNLSFWGVSKRNIDCHKVGIRKKDFKKIVYYDENLITGYSIGRKISEEEHLQGVTTDVLGQEFNYLQDGENYNIIITPDLLNIARLCVKGDAFVNYHFAKEDKYILNNYITTALITSEWYLGKDNKYDTFVSVIEAIQKAMSIIYSSKQIAREILVNMDCMKSVDDNIKVAVADFIIKIITGDRIYPSDLNIFSKKQWQSTTQADLDFSKSINNNIVLSAEKNIANQFGITLNDTFAEQKAEIEKRYIDRINELEAIINKMQVHRLEIIKKWLIGNWVYVLLAICIIYFLVWLICLLTSCDWTKGTISTGFAFSFAIPTIIAIIQHVSKSKKK